MRKAAKNLHVKATSGLQGDGGPLRVDRLHDTLVPEFDAVAVGEQSGV